MGPSRIAGRYELEEQLGEGGMGVVWRALDIKTGGYVAIKLMKDISDPVAVELFTKEWKALAEMSHPNIVEVRDVDVIEENRQKKPLFVMPLLRGATLADLIASASARLTLSRIVEIITQVCKGLQAAHQRGLVHRDLKPSNIFVMDDDTAKIIDFGVVHLAGSKSVTGQKGTFQYMSPEQAQLKEITPASDLFSLGVILYEALTLRRPFARNTAEETIQAVLKYIPPPVSEINPSINQSVSKVVHKCLAKQPIHRFASARELAETLQKAFRNEPIFDPAKIEPRIQRAKSAFKSGDEAFASEILAELEAEGNLDPRITVLRMQIEMAVKQKKTRQLLESARARMEQDEIPLALDKLREVLELDPENRDALAMRETMEKQRSETQIAKWFDLAQTHLGNRDFSSARHAVQEVLAIRNGDARALDLLEKIESTEADAKRIRDQKEQLYGSALKAYQNGEIDTALSKLERLFSVARAHPIAAIPERDAVYQSFYKEVRSERDSIHSALEEAQRQFSEKNFAGAMAVCRDLLVKYPSDGTFQALKIRIEDAERQELSSYIAEVSKRVESEPDLDRRANIVREACERYPNEAQFAQQLKLIRERRDLVNSIVAKARQYEERGQYSEAISQWDILRKIHPQYPGIAFELEQCKKKRDRQAREEEQARLVEEIDGLMEGRAYAKAIECARAALQEFPGDTELAGLLTLAEQGLERTKESRRLFEEGQRALAEKDLVRATDLLRSSLNLDPRGPGLRDAMVNVLAERARALVEENWRDAEPIYQEASELDPNHPAVRALRSSISEAKRQTLVGQCLTEARALVAAGNSQAAAERVRAARAEYPNDPRLEQYEASLRKEVNEIRRREERGRDRAALGEDRRVLEENPDRLKMRAVLERSQAIRAKHPDDPEIEQTVAEIELAIKRVAKVDDLSQLLSMETVLTGTDGRPGVVSKPGPVPPRGAERKGPKLVDKSAEKTKLFPTQDRKRKESALQPFLRKVETLFHEVGTFFQEGERRALAFARPAGKWSEIRLGAVGGIIVLIAVVGYRILNPGSGQEKKIIKPAATQYVHIIPDPPDSAVTSGGKPLADGAAAVGATVEVAHPGYKTRQVQVQQESDGKVALEPEPLHLSIQTSAKSGTVELDGRKIGDLSDGSMDEYSLPPDGGSHKLSVVGQGRRLFTVEFQSVAGSRPQVTLLDTKDAFVVTSLGNSAKVYGGTLLKSVRFGDQNVAVSPSGTDLTLSAQSGEIKYGQGDEQGSLVIDISNAPALAVHSLTTAGQLTITANVDSATLNVDGSPVQRQKHGWLISGLTGSHNFVLSAEGYKTQEWTMTLQRGQTRSRNIDLPRIAIPPKLASLLISGGTPGAEVFVDGQRVGELDANGSLQVPHRLNAGKHTLAMAKLNYEGRSVEISAKPPSDVSAPNVALIPWATLSFQTTARNVAVKFRRVGEAQFHDVNPSAKVPLAPGQYEIVAEALGFERFSTEVNLGRENVTVPLNTKAIPDYEFQDPDQITREGQWIRSKSPGKFVYLKPGFLHENLVFTRPGKTLFWDKKVEWVIEAPDKHARVQYVLESQKLSRKLVVGEADSDKKEAKADAVATGQATSRSVHVRVNGGHVTISNDRGVVLDDYTAQGRDFSSARIGIRTDSQFLVRSDNQ
jgi:serine/threonine protein kinase